MKSRLPGWRGGITSHYEIVESLAAGMNVNDHISKPIDKK